MGISFVYIDTWPAQTRVSLQEDERPWERGCPASRGLFDLPGKDGKRKGPVQAGSKFFLLSRKIEWTSARKVSFKQIIDILRVSGFFEFYIQTKKHWCLSTRFLMQNLADMRSFRRICLRLSHAREKRWISQSNAPEKGCVLFGNIQDCISEIQTRIY